VIDGRLDDEIWKVAGRSDAFREVDPAEGGEPRQRTEVRVAYDDEALYVAVRCDDSDPRGIFAKTPLPDVDMRSDDRVLRLLGSQSMSSRPPLLEPRARERPDPGSLRATTRGPRHRTAWADLLQRVFEVDVLCCPRCGGRMRILSAITDPDVAHRILEWLELPARPPPQGSSADAVSPESSRTNGVVPATDLAAGEWDASPEVAFDQSLPGEGLLGGDG